MPCCILQQLTTITFLKDGDRTSLYYVARSLMKIQRLFGIIPQIKGKGALSKVPIVDYFV